MRSTRNTRNETRRDATRCASASARLGLALAAGLATIGGCTKQPPAAPEPVSSAILPVDEAMQRRDWSRSAAEFESGEVFAGATRFPYVPQTSGDGVYSATLGPERRNALVDNVLFIGQTMALPFTYFVDPPFAKKTYRGVIYDPTHYAMPMLPPDAEPDRDAYAPPPLKDDEEPGETETGTTTSDGKKIPPLKDRIEPEPYSPDSPTEVPLEVQPPIITPEGSEPAPAEPGEPIKTTPEPEAAVPETPAPEAPATETPAPETPAPAPEATEPAPTEPAPADAAPETTEPAPEPQPDAAPVPAEDVNK